MSTEVKVCAVILAAGASQRMGRPKQLLPVAGRPMLVRVIDSALAAGLGQVIVVLGASAGEIAPALAGKPIVIAVNEQWQEGISSSLRAGLALALPQTEAALFIPGDMPRVTPAIIQAVVARFVATRKPIVLPLCDGRRGNPVLFASALFAELCALRGDEGGRVLVRSRPGDIAFVETGNPGVLFDVDTPDDYAQVAGAQP